MKDKDLRIGETLSIGVLIGIAIAGLCINRKEPVKKAPEQIVNLQRELEKAVGREDFEKAAELRDLIKERRRGDE